MSRRLFSLLWMTALLAGLALGGANLFMGELNQDEGWYLYASRLVSEGQWPYRDFAFTQAPLLPLVYALAYPLIGEGGVGAGRALTLVLSLLAAGCAAGLARRLVARELAGWAALTAFTLAFVNVYQSYFGTVVKTYALCALLLTAGAWVLAVARDRRSLLLHALAGLLLAGAAGTRISAGAMLPVVGLYLMWQRDRCGRASWLAFAVGGFAGLLLIFVPLLVAAPEAFRFFVLDYHSARSAGGLVEQLMLKAGCLSRVVQAYFRAVSLGVVLLLLGRVTGRTGERDPLRLTLWAGLGLMTMVHLSAPFPYDDYQVPLYPIFTALLAAGLASVMAPARPAIRLTVVLGLLLLSGASAFSSPVIQGWKVLGRDRIWWRMREKPALVQLREVARNLRQRSGAAEDLLTQDIYLAVETGLRVPHGLEMGPFSFYPQLDRAAALRLNVMNGEMLEECLARSSAPVAALSGYSFVMAAPAVVKVSEAEQQAWWDRVEQHYQLSTIVPDFGQGATSLRIYERRANKAAP